MVVPVVELVVFAEVAWQSETQVQLQVDSLLACDVNWVLNSAISVI